MDIFVMGYAHFFNEAEDSPCNEKSFELWQGWFATHAPLIYKLRRDLSELVERLNRSIAKAVEAINTVSWLPEGTCVHFVDISPRFDGHRFCDLKDGQLPDQYTSDDVWIWNLSRQDAQETGVADTEKDLMRYTRSFQEGGDPINNGAPIIGPGRGYGKTMRPFHPKAPGHAAIKAALFDAIQAAKVPGTIWE